MSQIIIRKIARKQGLTRYFTGKPCKWGHVVDRYVSDGQCVECAWEWGRKWAAANPEKARERNRKRYVANSEKAKERVRKDRMANPEKWMEWARNGRTADPGRPHHTTGNNQ